MSIKFNLSLDPKTNPFNQRELEIIKQRGYAPVFEHYLNRGLSIKNQNGLFGAKLKVLREIQKKLDTLTNSDDIIELTTDEFTLVSEAFAEDVPVYPNDSRIFCSYQEIVEGHLSNP